MVIPHLQLRQLCGFGVWYLLSSPLVITLFFSFEGPASLGSFAELKRDYFMIRNGCVDTRKGIEENIANAVFSFVGPASLGSFAELKRDNFMIRSGCVDTRKVIEENIANAVFSFEGPASLEALLQMRQAPQMKKSGQAGFLHSLFLRRVRDSNPRNLSVQQFSRLPQSTTLPTLRGKSNFKSSLSKRKSSFCTYL